MEKNIWRKINVRSKSQERKVKKVQIPVSESTVLTFLCVRPALGLALKYNFLPLQTALLWALCSQPSSLMKVRGKSASLGLCCAVWKPWEMFLSPSQLISELSLQEQTKEGNCSTAKLLAGCWCWQSLFCLRLSPCWQAASAALVGWRSAWFNIDRQGWGGQEGMKLSCWKSRDM